MSIARTAAFIAGSGLVVALAACAASGDSDKKAPAVATPPVPEGEIEDGRPFPTPPSEGVGPILQTTIKTEWGDLPIKYRVIDGDAVAEGDMVIPTDIQSATSVGRRWPNGIVPYVVSSNLPPIQGDLQGRDRVASAIAHWEEKTKLRFVPRTTERDYVHFRPGGGCSSAIGQQGGKQYINLNTAEGASTVAAIGIERSTDPAKPQQVHYFYTRGFATVGSVTRVDAIEPHSRYLPAPGRSSAAPSPTSTNPLPFLVDVAYANSGHLFAWYSDGTVSEGDASDLALYAPARPYALAAGKTTADLAGFAIDLADKTYAYYLDGTYSVGTTTDLASEAAPAPYALPDGKLPEDLQHVDVTQDGHFVAWFMSVRPNPDGGPAIRSPMTSVTGTAASFAGITPAGLGFTGQCGRGEAIHEIGHAIGFFHEQTRFDRDENIIIYWENILPEQRFNFEKHTLIVGTDTGAYDFGSIMHYDDHAFTSNRERTMSRLDGGAFDNQRNGLSDGDLEGVRAMYGP